LLPATVSADVLDTTASGRVSVACEELRKAVA